MNNWLIEKLTNGSLSELKKLKALEVIGDTPLINEEQLDEFLSRPLERLFGKENDKIGEMIFYGNIWSRLMHYKKAGDKYAGHTHPHDHITLLASGGVIAQVDGYEPEKFFAPAWIVIPKNQEHQFIALEDNTSCYCIHAKRGEFNEVDELYDMTNVVSLTPLNNSEATK